MKEGQGNARDKRRRFGVEGFVVKVKSKNSIKIALPITGQVYQLGRGVEEVDAPHHPSTTMFMPWWTLGLLHCSVIGFQKFISR